MWWKYLIVIIVSYFIGNISFARIISAKKKKDITKQGSGNPGTMNMLRTYGAKVGFLTLVLDALKGVIPALTGLLVFRWAGLNEDVGLYVGGLSAVVGHMFPVLYKFKGGKGVATTGGVLIYCFWFPALICIALTILVIWLFRYISVGSMLLVVSFTILSCFKFFIPGTNACIVIWAAILMVMCIARHHANINRLIHGKENKLGHKV